MEFDRFIKTDIKTNEEFISSTPLFYSLPAETIKEIASKILEKKFSKDEIIVKEGEKGDSFYIIKSGHVAVIKYEKNHEELVMAKLDAGECFGEIALLYDQPRSATIKALDEVLTLQLLRHDFQELLKKYPEVQKQMSYILDSRVSLLDLSDEKAKEKFKTQNQIKVDLTLLDLLGKFNQAAGGAEQINHCKETALLVNEMSKILCPMVSDELVCAAYLHEIGKISLSESLVQKERKGEPLTGEEKAKFQKVYDITIDILNPFKILKENISFIKYLNETDWKKMPLEAQILKVAGDYEEMVNHFYQNLDGEKALEKIKEKSGTLYNPKVIKALEKTLEKFKRLIAEDQIYFIRCMNVALDHKDHYTLAHSYHTGEMALKIARQININKREIDLLKQACDLHDVGKIHIKEEILNAPRKLTAEEFEIMKKHPVWSAHFFAEIPGMDELVDVIKHHHEKYDGTGYPDGLKGDKINLLSRIMCIADVYSALTTPRVYRLDEENNKVAFDNTKTLGIMKEMQEKNAFDPEIFKIFCQIIEKENK